MRDSSPLLSISVFRSRSYVPNRTALFGTEPYSSEPIPKTFADRFTTTSSRMSRERTSVQAPEPMLTDRLLHDVKRPFVTAFGAEFAVQLQQRLAELGRVHADDLHALASHRAPSDGRNGRVRTSTPPAIPPDTSDFTGWRLSLPDDGTPIVPAHQIPRPRPDYILSAAAVHDPAACPERESPPLVAYPSCR